MKFLRKVRRGKWVKHPSDDWPEDSGLSCDVLDDMQTNECALSVYAITDATDRKRVAVAMAATKQEIALVDYIVFDGSSLESLGVTIQQTKGDTPDSGVNELHYDLGNLTLKRLAQLTEIVSAGEHERIRRSDVKELLCAAARSGQLNVASIKFPKMRKNLSECS